MSESLIHLSVPFGSSSNMSIRTLLNYPMLVGEAIGVFTPILLVMEKSFS
jgi:hypothetical protein